MTICSAANTEPDFPANDPPSKNDPEDPPQKKKKRSRLITEEAWYQTGLQISVPFFIAGIGTIGAGLVLAKVKVRTAEHCLYIFSLRLLNFLFDYS